jgi:hypothetical protein
MPSCGVRRLSSAWDFLQGILGISGKFCSWIVIAQTGAEMTLSNIPAGRENVSDPAVNPWSRQFWNLTEQGQIFRRDKDIADRLARAAGHKDAMSSRLKTAK